MVTTAEMLEAEGMRCHCLGRATLDEPVFILRAQDILAPRVVVRWAHLAEQAGSSHAEWTTVTVTASDYGFWELGRFSVAYRSLFGESPSTALRRPPATP